jgi:hypothetical protein
MDQAGRLVLKLVNAEGEDAVDPDVSVQVLRLDGVSMLRADNIEFPPQHRFGLPAFPQAQNLRCTITSSRYRFVQSEFFTLDAGQDRTTRALLAREPDKWTPNFLAWGTLSARFDGLKTILANKLLKTKHGPDVGVVTPGVYDAMPAPMSLAKMALLNLYSVLSDEQYPLGQSPWFSFVKQILVIDRERFVAIVKDELYTVIQQILGNLSTYKKQGFFAGDTSLHHDNIPSQYTVSDMISVKCRYQCGNVQFTVARVTGSAGAEVLLDCDMDEHANLLEHLDDVFVHIFTGGTHPIDIHEYIVQKASLQGRKADLGYTLEARPAA